jgi:hypothetical protein
VKNQLRYGKLKYISFVLLDLLCLAGANMLAAWIYISTHNTRRHRYSYADHWSIVVFMLVIDVFITIAFNTLNRVLMRRALKEIIASVKHVALSFVLLALVLFTIKLGADYSRFTVYLAYIIDLILLVSTHIAWKELLKRLLRRGRQPTALLMTTDKFLDEGIDMLTKSGVDVRAIFLLKAGMGKSRDDIDEVQTEDEATACICWTPLDRVYIYGLDHQMISEKLKHACEEMGVTIDFVDFEYRILELKTVANEDPKYGALSFLEGKRDIPFPIRRVYWITQTEADQHRGFHAHKQNCQLLFCPHGKIDIILDDGSNEKKTVTLDGPRKGLLLMPGLWREMVWRESGSVLCVLASEYYDEKEYIRNYDEFIAYRNRETLPLDDGMTGAST